MSRPNPTQETIDHYVDHNDKLDPYPTESALVFLNCVSDYEISTTERCKILEHALSNVLGRLEQLEGKA
jgi:hypothetical protein